MNNLKRVGSIFLNNEVLISNPCYETDCRSNILIDGIEDGLYNCFVEISDEGKWGKRVARMVAIHNDYDISVLNEYAFDEGCVGVDSGTMSISDIDYYDKYHNDNIDDDWYEKNVCAWCYKKKAHIADRKSFISTSGFGDGCYDVFSRVRNGNTIAIEVVFIDNNKDDE